MSSVASSGLPQQSAGYHDDDGVPRRRRCRELRASIVLGRNFRVYHGGQKLRRLSYWSETSASTMVARNSGVYHTGQELLRLPWLSGTWESTILVRNFCACIVIGDFCDPRKFSARATITCHLIVLLRLPSFRGSSRSIWHFQRSSCLFSSLQTLYSIPDPRYLRWLPATSRLSQPSASSRGIEYIPGLRLSLRFQ